MAVMKKTIHSSHNQSGIHLLLAPTPGRPSFAIEEPVGLDRAGWPVGLGFPFAKGELKDLASLAVLTPDNLPVPLQSKILNRWPDGSVRWAHVLFLADLKRQATAEWRLEWNTGAESPGRQGRRPGPGRGQERQDRVAMNGGLTVAFSTGGPNLIDSVKVNGREVLDLSRKNGFMIKTADRAIFEAPAGKPVRLAVEESGPLRAIVRTEGQPPGGRRAVRSSTTARGSSSMPAPRGSRSSTASRTGRAPRLTDIASMTLGLPLAPSRAPYLGLTSEYKIDKFYEFRRAVLDLFGRGRFLRRLRRGEDFQGRRHGDPRDGL